MARFVPFIVNTATKARRKSAGKQPYNRWSREKYSGIGRVLICYGIKLSIDHNCGGTVTFEAKVPELAEHYARDFGAAPLPSFGGAPRYEISGEAAMNLFITYLK